MAVTFPTDKGMTLPPHYLWTRDKYEQATALGLLGPEDKVELIEGEIVQKMPQNDPHQSAIGAMQETLGQIFTRDNWLRIQMPLALSTKSMPEPDLAVVVGSWRDYK
ncbi:MAG: Uma2 family endonuclease, partial [Armatimonadota bacterium]|nr:Uma2 family endonuclease [Armatimonadota bacterium]